MLIPLVTSATGCGGTGASSAQPQTAGPLPAITWWQPLAPSVGTPTAIVLYGQQFLDFFHADTTAGIAATTDATWSSSGDAVVLAGANGPSSQLLVAPTPLPGQTRVIFQHPGAATLTAATSGGTASIPVLAYASVDFGCDFRAFGAFPAPDPTLGAAAFATAAGSTTPCMTVAAPATTPVTFHFPFGATLTTDGNDPAVPVAAGVQRAPEFRLIPASMWRNDFTTIDAGTLSAALAPCSSSSGCAALNARVILFKTATGAIVKFDAREPDGTSIIGYYEVTDATGQFPY